MKYRRQSQGMSSGAAVLTDDLLMKGLEGTPCLCAHKHMKLSLFHLFQRGYLPHSFFLTKRVYYNHTASLRSHSILGPLLILYIAIVKVYN